MNNVILALLVCIALAMSIFNGVHVFLRSRSSKKNYSLLVQALEHIKEGFILVDENNNYLLSNPAVVKIFPGITKLLKGESILHIEGWPEKLKDGESDLIEFSLSRINQPPGPNPESEQGTEGSRQLPVASPALAGENEISLRELRYFRASVSPMFNNTQTLIARIILFSEITGSVNLLRKLENAAYMDALTGLYSRKHFFELAAVEIERAQRLNQSIYAAMLDLDFFKKVNDTYGHAAGDMVLKTAAEVIHKSIRTYDLLGRYGGEEFVILFTNLDTTELHNPAERIRENMEHNITNYEGEEIKITCSIGLAKFLEGDTLETTIKKADAALYAAKRAGRNRIKIYDDLVAG